jgi:ATP-dependent helicase/nuclease subunit A
VLGALDAAMLCARWPDRDQRLSNLDALRGLTAEEKIASDDQHVGAGERAVVIATYHRAKGLEWPVVVLSSLDRGDRRDAFEMCPETDRAAFDASVVPVGGSPRWFPASTIPMRGAERRPLAFTSAP